jgi:hypothetical protein
MKKEKLSHVEIRFVLFYKKHKTFIEFEIASHKPIKNGC